jgi:hypothetical protein
MGSLARAAVFDAPVDAPTYALQALVPFLFGLVCSRIYRSRLWSLLVCRGDTGLTIGNSDGHSAETGQHQRYCSKAANEGFTPH